MAPMSYVYTTHTTAVIFSEASVWTESQLPSNSQTVSADDQKCKEENANSFAI